MRTKAIDWRMAFSRGLPLLRVFLRFMAALVSLLAITEAHSQELAGSASPFERRAANAVYEVFPFDRQTFQLTAYGNDPISFVFYGKTPSDVVPISCEQDGRLRLVSYGNEVGVFTIARCTEQRTRLNALAQDAPAGLRRTLDALGQGARRPSEAELRRAGLFYERRQLADGTQQHYFPVLIVSHGVLPAPTVVTISRSAVWIVQANLTNLCSLDAKHRLCTDTMQSLSEIGVLLAK